MPQLLGVQNLKIFLKNKQNEFEHDKFECKIFVHITYEVFTNDKH